MTVIITDRLHVKDGANYKIMKQVENNSDACGVIDACCDDRDKSPLVFHRLTFNSIPLIAPYLERSGSLSCDYTIGGIYMWTEYFKYHYCIYENTLFIKGVAEDDTRKTAFSLPIGQLPLSESVRLLGCYCRQHGLPLVFSAIPEEHIKEFEALSPVGVARLDEWGDYVYDAESLATLAGNKLKKKRNRVNKFVLTYPNHEVKPITQENLPEIKEFYARLIKTKDDEGMAAYERRQVANVLKNYGNYPFEGLVLTVEGKVVAFSVGEVIGDTLYDHIEKTDHDYVGANEFINMSMVKYCLERHGIRYVNREDDAGDEGLKQAKLAYNPIIFLNKYNVSF